MMIMVSCLFVHRVEPACSDDLGECERRDSQGSSRLPETPTSAVGDLHTHLFLSNLAIPITGDENFFKIASFSMRILKP